VSFGTAAVHTRKMPWDNNGEGTDLENTVEQNGKSLQSFWTCRGTFENLWALISKVL